MKIKPIKSAEEYQAALTAIDRLLEAAEGRPAEEQLELLSILVEAYEDRCYPIDPPDPIEAIKFHREQNALTRQDLEPYMGPRQWVTEVLNHKRALSLPAEAPTINPPRPPPQQELDFGYGPANPFPATRAGESRPVQAQ